jgi:TolB protein
MRQAIRGELALMVANTDGTEEKKLATWGVKERESFVGPAWSPDGKSIVCVLTSLTGGSHTSVIEVRVEDGAEKPITSQSWNWISQLAWLSDGSGLVMTARGQTSQFDQIWHLSYPDGKARRITNDLNGYLGLSVTVDSNTLAALQVEIVSHIWIAPDGDASRAKQITSGTALYVSPSWTPDGKLVYLSDASGNPDLWIMEPDGSNQKQLTFNVGGNFRPTVSPDGRYVVFMSDRTGGTNIWRMDIDFEFRLIC